MNKVTINGIASILILLSDLPGLAQSLFAVPPTKVSIHNPKSTEGQRNRTTISVAVPADAGNSLGVIILTQLPNIDQWDWGNLEPEVYLGDYSLRARGETGLALATLSESGHGLKVVLTPPVEPGKTVNITFRGFNPEANIYQWSTELLASGTNPVRYSGPTLRVSVYNIDPLR